MSSWRRSRRSMCSATSVATLRRACASRRRTSTSSARYSAGCSEIDPHDWNSLLQGIKLSRRHRSVQRPVRRHLLRVPPHRPAALCRMWTCATLPASTPTSSRTRQRTRSARPRSGEGLLLLQLNCATSLLERSTPTACGRSARYPASQVHAVCYTVAELGCRG